MKGFYLKFCITVMIIKCFDCKNDFLLNKKKKAQGKKFSVPFSIIK